MTSDKLGEEILPWGRGPGFPSFSHCWAPRAFCSGDLPYLAHCPCSVRVPTQTSCLQHKQVHFIKCSVTDADGCGPHSWSTVLRPCSSVPSKELRGLPLRYTSPHLAERLCTSHFTSQSLSLLPPNGIMTEPTL